MGLHEFQTALKSTQTQRNVMGNGEMKFPVQKGRQADRRTLLSGAFATQDP